MTDPCANTDQCHHWPRHDDRCHRNTAPHSDVCSVHADQDDAPWTDAHHIDDCCTNCCPGDEVHHD